MNKGVTFLVAILLVLVVDLFHWETPQNPSQDLNDNLITNAEASSNSTVQGLNFGLGFNPNFRFQNRDGASSMTRAPILDPVTLLLFGSGLVGLAGLGRKKIKR